MGSNLKKFRSLNYKTKLLYAGTILSLGIVGTFWLNKFLRNSFISRKANIEDKLEIFLDKKVDLGSYSGMRLFGISLANPKVIDKENLYSGIKAKNIYVGVMPIRSLLNQKLIMKLILKP